MRGRIGTEGESVLLSGIAQRVAVKIVRQELRDAVDRLSTHRDDEADLRYYNATGRWPDDSP